MTLRIGRSVALASLLAASALVSACGQITDRQGYMQDPVLTASIQPGVDNRESVAGTLGRPTFVGQFDQRDWYYVTRVTKQFGFNLPRPATQSVLHIRFDEAGNVLTTERTGIDKVASIQPYDEKTPTLGRDRSFLEELFGNIGTVGAPGAGTNPTPQ
ncbi:outer membrane protein assembly factor BamE [Allosphingosinicella flava]|uniref:Outer membrane protein assembly factor BamE n=1 Tax=Allosphingosinicella flava TaxID=2771430 RepID=A0A7T2LLQ0_9SPHN|nr:outer membrane protein assembly factor BamE [Sphingosinicella flava]QPQ54669.1 outer membrane protein assembly factor BamE [Sphingosinicella flava]